jgi:hypothetical protein
MKHLFVFSYECRGNMAQNEGSYTQGRIAGDFLSSRKTD